MSSLRAKRDGQAKRYAIAEWKRKNPRKTVKPCEMAGCTRTGAAQFFGYCASCWKGQPAS